MLSMRGLVRVARFLRAMEAAVDACLAFNGMAQDPAAAVLACRSHHVDGTFEAVECSGLVPHTDGEHAALAAAADVTCAHGPCLLLCLPAPDTQVDCRGGSAA